MKDTMTEPFRVGIIGGGPAALFLYQALLQSKSAQQGLCVSLFEAGKQLGEGMPYSPQGAGIEHITNISGNEIPPLTEPVVDWIKSLPQEVLEEFHLDRDSLHDFKVLPRLLFGKYLAAQFQRLLESARTQSTDTTVHLQTPVMDVQLDDRSNEVVVIAKGGVAHRFDSVVLCTGHVWPIPHEQTIPNYFDSPYPPSKLHGIRNHPIAIRGASLTAIDAVRTLARIHGQFHTTKAGTLTYEACEGAHQFQMVLHSREGFLPGIRFHLEDPRLEKREGLSESEIDQHRQKNNGFISLDYLFEEDFKASFRDKDPEFFANIRDLKMEAFVELMLRERENSDPFAYFQREYREARESIRNQESIYWKEKLAILSFSLNRPAKYFSAEDTLRLQEVLMPLIAVVIAFTPQSSCEELLALHAAGKLELKAVVAESRIEPQSEGGIDYIYSSDSEHIEAAHFGTFIDCIGQKHLSFEQFPFDGLKREGIISPAQVRFQSRNQAIRLLNEGNERIVVNEKEAFLRVPGVAINDDFQAIGIDGQPNPRLYVMAVPLIGGHNPDYSGLDFCEYAAGRIVNCLVEISRSATSPNRHGMPQ